MLETSAFLAQNIGTEKARSELLIAPVLLEVRSLAHGAVSLFSGSEFDVAPKRGLKGCCDYLLTRSPNQILIQAPVIAIVEAKNEDIKGGIPQCVAEMFAAKLFNEQEGTNLETMYGCVTSGTAWRFFKLHNMTAFVDGREYSIDSLTKILGILKYIALEG
jgi:hypothetical protein